MQNLIEKRNQLLSEAQRLALSTEGTSEERNAKLKAMLADVASLETVIEAEQRSARISTEAIRPAVDGGMKVATTEEKRKAAFANYLRHGIVAPELRTVQNGNLVEVRDLLTTTGSISGGLFIEQAFDAQLHEAQKNYGQITQLVRNYATETGAPIKTSGIDFTGVTATFAAEATGYTESDPAVSGALSNTDMANGLIKVSVQELQDAAYNVENLIQNGFAQVYYRTASNAIVNGNSLNVASILSPFSGTPTLPVTTSAAPTAIAYPDLVGVYSKIDGAFLNSSTWAFNSSVRGQVLGITNTQGTPIFQIGGFAQNGTLDSCIGRPVAIVEQLPGLTAAAVGSAVLADWNALYTFRTVRNSFNVVRLNERFRDQGYIAFTLEFRMGGYLNPMGASKHASALIQHA
jgi:HK97 family phage major capsid protein